LRRVSVDELSKRFALIAAQEHITIAPDAIATIARAADGSVRDGLSLLDQAIARGTEDSGIISAELVEDMLGLSDRTLVFKLMQAISKGDIAAALSITDIAHAKGADLGVLLGDLLALVHLLTRHKFVPSLAESGTLPELESKTGLELAAQLSVPWLGRLWQMLLKGVAEVETCPDRKAGAEMILIRLCHVADMPPPAELIKKLQDQPTPLSNTLAPPPGNGGGGGARAVAAGQAGGTPMLADAAPAPKKITFPDVVALAATRGDMMLYAHLRQSAHVVRFAPPVIELRLEPDAPRDFSHRLAKLLDTETQRRWTIVISDAPGEPTIAETERATEMSVRTEAANHPLVEAILRMFPGARIETAQAPPEPETTVPIWADFAPEDAEPITEEDF